MLDRLKAYAKTALPEPIVSLLTAVRNPRDLRATLTFLLTDYRDMSFSARASFLRNLYRISAKVESPHSQEEILGFVQAILRLPKDIPGAIVEAGCYKGSSTAKFSLAAAAVDRELVVFDSFEGIPENDEAHTKNIFGEAASFKRGDYKGTLEQVRANVARFGKPQQCTFVQGWLEDTLPNHKGPVAAAYIDVDLASSTRTCLKYLYPLLSPGGVIFSQDGHLPLVIEVFADELFWKTELGIDKPQIFGLGTQKLISLTKPPSGSAPHMS